MISAVQASHILLAGLCNASATAQYISQQGWPSITFNETGIKPGGEGEEDSACADLIEAILSGQAYDLTKTARQVRESLVGKMFEGSRPDFPVTDLDLATSIDRFGFAMVVNRTNGRFIAAPVYF